MDSAPESPADFSVKDWKLALAEVKTAFTDKHLPILAAGVAYFSTLAFFPLLAGAVAISALVIEPEHLQSVVVAVERYLPTDVAKLVASQLATLMERESDTLLAAVLAIGVSLFGAAGASKNLVGAANIAYDVKESRGWIVQQLRSIGWTLAGIGFGFVVAIMLVANQKILTGFGLMPPFTDVVLYGRWVVILLLITLALAVFYRYGPARKNPKWQWISWGAIAATLLWLAGTALFFVYVQNFGNYGRSYSLFAGIIILMIWFNLSAFAVLLGATVNKGLERAAQRSQG